jgi:hypothetical protein
MSTKTTFKRVALVAVAALGLGVLSVAPSNAAAQLDSLAVSLASTTQKTTETLTATASVLTATLAGQQGVDTLTVTASIVSGPAYVQPILAFKESTTAVASNTADSSVQTVTPNDTSTITQATAKYNVYLKAPSVVGTYVVKITPTGGVNAAAVTVSIVVSAVAIQGPDATNSELYLLTDWTYNNVVASCGGTCNYSPIAQTSANTVDTRTVTVVAPVGALLGSALWVAKGANTSAVFARTPVTVTVTGPAYVATQSDPQNAYSQKTSGYTETYLVNTGVDPYLNSATSADASIFIYSTGVGGVVTITATMAGVELGKRSFSIIGASTAYVFGTPSKSVVGVSESMTVAVTGTDKVGTSTGAASVYAFSSDTTVATVNTTQASTVVVTGVKSGTATITVGNASTLATSTITKTLAVKVGSTSAATVSLSMSPSAPTAGEKVTVTLTATDASGNPVGDGARLLLAAGGFSNSVTINGSTVPTVETVTLTAGVATYIFYAPAAGVVTFTATEGSATTSTTKGTITGSVTVSNPALDAATDAANEAYDAANAATDAALAAAEAADAATVAAQEASDAVAALSESVTKLIAGLQAQIKSLAAVVAKIAKKVKA